MGIKALVADDHELFRSGMKQLLVDALGADDVREAETLDQAIELLTNGGAGDLVLVDLRMPGMSGAEALAALRDGFPDAKIAVVSAWEERPEIFAALSAGVHGYIPKSLPSNEIASAIKSVLEGRIFVPPAVGKRRRRRSDTRTVARRKHQREAYLAPKGSAERTAERPVFQRD